MGLTMLILRQVTFDVRYSGREQTASTVDGQRHIVTVYGKTLVTSNKILITYISLCYILPGSVTGALYVGWVEYVACMSTYGRCGKFREEKHLLLRFTPRPLCAPL